MKRDMKNVRARWINSNLPLAPVSVYPVRRASLGSTTSEQREPELNTAFLLMAQYDGRAVIPVEELVRDYFSHLTLDKFLRKVGAGDIAIPLVRIEASQKAAKGVHLQDLAEYIDARRAAARKELAQLTR